MPKRPNRPLRKGRVLPTPIDTEFFVKESSFLVSKTDLKGIITYANSVFIEISGYSEEELLHKPHSLVRHPDMPKVAYQGLWDTIQAGKEWRGIVKNLRKDGAFYWVDAFVTPSYRDNELIGYMSIRRRPTKEQVQEASTLYKKLILEENNG